MKELAFSSHSFTLLDIKEKQTMVGGGKVRRTSDVVNGDDAGGQQFPRGAKSAVPELLVGADACGRRRQHVVNVRAKRSALGLHVQRGARPGRLTDDAGTFQQQVDGVRGQYGDEYQQDSETTQTHNAHRETHGVSSPAARLLNSSTNTHIISAESDFYFLFLLSRSV